MNSPHDVVRHHSLFEQRAKCLQSLAHELQHQTHVGPVRPMVLEVVDEVADVLVADVCLVGVAKVPQDLPLENVLVSAIALGTQYLQSVVVAIALAAEQKLSAATWCLGMGTTYGEYVSLTSHTAEYRRTPACSRPSTSVVDIPDINWVEMAGFVGA